MIYKSFSNKLTAFAAAVLLCCSVFFIQSNARAQAPCFCLAYTSTFNGDNLFTCSPTNALAPCSISDCGDCRYLVIQGDNLGLGCCLSSLKISSGGQCFCACGLLSKPSGYSAWTTTVVNPPIPPATWNPNMCYTSDLTLTDGTGSNPLCGSDIQPCTCGGYGTIPPGCDGSLLFVRICGTFPMTITVSSTGCGSCSQSITLY